MEKYFLVLKIILTPFISVLFLFLTNSDLFLYPLVFSLVVTLSNFKLHRFQLVIGMILSIILSYLSFFIGFYGYSLFHKLIDFVGIPNDITIGEWFYTDLAGCISIFIIAPFLTIFLNKLLFRNTKTKLTKWILFLTTFLILFVSFVYHNQETNNIFQIFNLWQLVTIFGLQLIINQESIVVMFEKKGIKASSQQQL